jgi:metal transporter CNNM
MKEKLAAGCVIASSFFAGRSKAEEIPTSESGARQTVSVLAEDTVDALATPRERHFRLKNRSELTEFLMESDLSTASHAQLEIFDERNQLIKTVEIPLTEDKDCNQILIWLGIASCLVGSACLSGMNVGLMSVNRLDLEVKAEQGDLNAQKVLALREDGNTVLATILWSNVGVNCLLTLLTDSVLAGAAGFAFSVGGLTLFGEILPQGYFSRNALDMGAKLAPAIELLKYTLYPITKPTGLLLDRVVGREMVEFMQEKQLEDVLHFHKKHPNPEISALEAQGAVNFLALDDVSLAEQGQDLSPRSVIRLVNSEGVFELPEFSEDTADPFLQQVQRADVPWIVLTDEHNAPQYLLDADAFLRHSVYENERTFIQKYCHRPLVVSNPAESFGSALQRLQVAPERYDDGVIDNDVILLWTEDCKKIITGADILGRLLRGVVQSRAAV